MFHQSNLPITDSVLVADDHPAHGELLEELLTPQGCKVVSVPDGVAALEELTRTQFDTVLLDVMMPHLNGFEVCPFSARPCSACSVLSPALLTCLHDFVHVRRWPNLENVAMGQRRMLADELYSMIHVPRL